jgi:hypothetical protein
MLPVGLAEEVAMSDKIAKATALILVLAGLFFAIGKLGDAWQYACAQNRNMSGSPNLRLSSRR